VFSFAQLSSILESIPEADRAQAFENATQVELAREKTRQMQLETAGSFSLL
jgi:hypothetical protein